MSELYTERQQELFHNKAARTARSYLNRVRQLPHTPKGMEPFFKVLEQIYVEMQGASIPADKVAIGTFCIMVPIELIYAAGGMPLRLCSGSYTAYSIGDDFVPRDACPLVKAVIGFQQIGVSPLYHDCKLMIIPVTCDCKKKVAGMLSEIVPTVALQVPAGKDEDADIEQYQKELYRLIPEIEKVTGMQITTQTLSHSIEAVGYAQYELSKFLTYRKIRPALLHGAQVMAVMNAYAYMPIEEWSNSMHLLNKELEERRQAQQWIGRDNQPRILVTGSPIAFPNIKIPLLIEEMGGLLVADETCMGERALYDPLSVIDWSLDGMLRALAGRYIRPCSCPVFVNNRQRIFKLKQMIQDHQVQGVIYHVLRGCLVYDYEFHVIEEELGRLGIPVIRLESDYNEEDVEQLRIRTEAFIEMIKMKDFAEKKLQGGR